MFHLIFLQLVQNSPLLFQYVVLLPQMCCEDSDYCVCLTSSTLRGLKAEMGR